MRVCQVTIGFDRFRVQVVSELQFTDFCIGFRGMLALSPKLCFLVLQVLRG